MGIFFRELCCIKPLNMKTILSSIALLPIVLAAFNTLAQTNGPAGTIDGKWLMELNSIDIGTVRLVMDFNALDSTFEARTRKGADREILGFWTSSLGRLLTKNFKNGSLLRIVHGKIRQAQDTLFLTGIFTSPIGNYYFNGAVTDQVMTARLTDAIGGNRGTMAATRKTPSIPLEDYGLLFRHAVNTAEAKMYDPDISESRKWKKFTRKMASTTNEVEDDLEMVFAFFHHSRKLPFSHFSLLKFPENTEPTAEIDNPQVSLKELPHETVLMRVNSFGGTSVEMDSVLTLVKQHQYKNLIVDLRDNPGGSVNAGMTFASHLADTVFFGGVFLTQRWFAHHSIPPSNEEYVRLPHFTESNLDLIIKGIHEEEGLCFKIIPEPPRFNGSVYLLTNGNTASTCEPIVYGLQQQLKAVVVGERTAGAMLNGERFPVGKGFTLVVPTATYYTSDGKKLDQRGVKPDVKTKSEDALDYVMKHLITEQPKHNHQQ